jgi:hypothetical protein
MNDDIFKIDIDSMVTESSAVSDDVMDLSVDDNFNEGANDWYARMEDNTVPKGTMIQTPDGSLIDAYELRNDETRKKLGEPLKGKSVKESAEEVSIPLTGTKDNPTEDAYNANLAKLRKSFNDALDAFEAYSKQK